MPDYRYVLHLHDGEHEQIVRHTSRRPLSAGAVISIPGTGEWAVQEIISNDDPTHTDGIAICEPAGGEQRSA